MILGYNTNGFAHHDLLAAIDVIAETGYRSVAITLDHGALNPYDDNLLAQLDLVRERLGRYGMRSVVETGARFLLDPRAKHEPTLMSAEPESRHRRVDFLRRAADIAGELGSDCLSLWSGAIRHPVASAAAFDRLVDGLQRVLDYAARREVVLGFEPEPGMFIATMRDFECLVERIDSPRLGLTLDVGHVHCQREGTPADFIRQWRDRLVNIHIEDMRAGVHEHLMFGEGEVDFPPILAALACVEYRGGLHVELSGHSRDAPTAAQKAYEFLWPLVHG